MLLVVKTWAGAEQFCGEEGRGHLASVRDQYIYMTMAMQLDRLNLGKSENLRNKYLFGSVEQTKAMKASGDGAMEAPGTSQLGRLTSLTT